MHCRCCGQELPAQYLIQYHNMPKSAQFFPDKNNVDKENGVDLTLYQCKFCGMIQLTGKPVPYYRDVIRSVDISKEMIRFRQRQFSKWVSEYNLKHKKIVEIGCGTGEYMNIMRTLDVDVYGIENSQDAVNMAAQKGCKVFQQFISSSTFQIREAPYDAFYILNFLEHIPLPGEFLRGIYYNLLDNAVGLIEVPNMNMILRDKLYSELIQDHLLYFTEETLKRLLEWNGFEICSSSTIWHQYILSIVVRKRQNIDISHFLNQKKNIAHSVAVFLNRMKKQNIKVAVWGAGHQALANLSLLNMSSKIYCVIDSAKFKQNKLTPATHIPIVAPNILECGEVGAVLIMAAGYSNEILDIMRLRYPKIVRAVLTIDGVVEDVQR